MDNIENYKYALRAVQKKEIKQRKTIKKLLQDKEELKKQLLLHNVLQANPEKVCELIRQKFDDWVFGLETQAGEKLKVVDSTDFNDIITEIESKLKDL